MGLKMVPHGLVNKLAIACGIVLSMLTAGCATQKIAPQTAAVAPAPEFTLGAGDRLHITTFNEESLSGDFLIAANGDLAMPLVGAIPAAGKTVTQLASEITARLSDGFINDAKVGVELLSARPYYILGEVVEPGEYAYGSGMTVLNAVAKAKGFSYRANHKRVFIRRSGADAEIEVPLTVATPVMPGDTIRIIERYF